MIGVAGDHLDHGAWFDAKTVQVFEQPPIAFENANYRCLTAGP